MKIRTTQSFKDAINEARRVFGTDDNNTTAICKRALKCHKNEGFEYSKCNDKSIGNPVTINVNCGLPAKELQGLVIAYIHRCIEKNSSRRQSALTLDKCDNYIIEGE